METIKCAWCQKDTERAAGVAADSHGICASCADEWQDDGAYRLSYRLAQRENLKADIAAFQTWAWAVAKARRFQARELQAAA
jgi:hypothetical protein